MVNTDIKIDFILCSQRWRSCIQSAKTRPGANCSSDHQLLKAKFRLKLKKTRKNNRPARYALNQMLYEFAVEVTNRLEQLDLINSMPKELLTEAILHSKWQTKSSQRKRKARRQSGYLRRLYK